MKKFKNQNAITLIALVITIVVLLILGLRVVANGGVGGYYLAASYGDEGTGSYGLRPVVSLKSDIKITEVNDGIKIE